MSPYGSEGLAQLRADLQAFADERRTLRERAEAAEAKLAEVETERDELVNAASLAVMVWLPLLADVELHPQENEARVALDVLKHALRDADARAGLAAGKEKSHE